MKSKVILLASLVILGITSLKAQLNVGSTSAPNADAMLQVTSSSKGILFPLVALTSTTSPAPLTANVAGMIVYNTATAGDVYPGPYFNDGTKWIFFGVKPGDAIFNALSTNQAAYTSAAANTWVAVTAAEYANVLSTVSGAGAYGVPEATFNSSINAGFYSNVTSSLNSANSTQVPATSYPIAMKFRTAGNGTTVTSQLKFGATSQNTFNNYLGTTSAITAVTGGTYYYVAKAPTASLPAIGYVGMYISGDNTALAGAQITGTFYINGTTGGGDLANGANLPDANNSNFQPLIQVLGTSTKSW